MKKLFLSVFVLFVFTLAGACSSISSTPPPAGTSMARVKEGMSSNEVRKIMGNPSETRPYMTGKQWIPFYWGPDTHRTDWIYNKKGRVVFSRNRYSGRLKVIRVSYEPKIK